MNENESLIALYISLIDVLLDAKKIENYFAMLHLASACTTFRAAELWDRF